MLPFKRLVKKQLGELLIERGVILEDSAMLSAGSFPIDCLEGAQGKDTAYDLDTISIKKGTVALEKRLIAKALGITKGNKTRAAELLEISHRALLYKIKGYNL